MSDNAKEWCFASMIEVSHFLGRSGGYISACLSNGRKPRSLDKQKFDVIVRGRKAVVLRIVIEVDAPPGQAIGFKEDLAMRLEDAGKTRVVKIEEIAPEQMRLI